MVTAVGPSSKRCNKVTLPAITVPNFWSLYRTISPTYRLILFNVKVIRAGWKHACESEKCIRLHTLLVHSSYPFCFAVLQFIPVWTFWIFLCWSGNILRRYISFLLLCANLFFFGLHLLQHQKWSIHCKNILYIIHTLACFWIVRCSTDYFYTSHKTLLKLFQFSKLLRLCIFLYIGVYVFGLLSETKLSPKVQ